MKRLLFLLIFVFILSGCATYKFQKGTKPPFDKGYVASYEGDIIPEYTIGKDNSAPAELSLAKERFNRRRLTVEKYYKSMGYIENRVKQVFWEPPVMVLNVIIGVFKLPYIAYSDYKYENDPKYRAMVAKKDEDEYQKEKTRIKSLKEELGAYIQKDLSQESGTAIPEQVEKVTQAPPAETQPSIENKTEPSKVVEKEEVTPKQEVKTPEVLPVNKEETVPDQEVKIPQPAPVEKQEKAEEKIEPATEKQEAAENKIEPLTKPVEVKPAAPEPVVTPSVPAVPELPSPVAVIIARPAKGFSPLKVDFYGTKSHSPNGRIVSYSWDFGDGDTSSKPKVSNTYWSTTYGSRNFIVTLTVKDIKGVTATATQIIEVTNK